jgi:hypothetical protein
MKHLKIFEDFDQDQWQIDYDQLIMDMEEEAEPEGGPIATEYGTRMEEMEKEREEGTRANGNEEPLSDGVDEVHDKLKTHLNDAQISNLIGYLEEEKDDNFIQTRLEFYGVDPENLEMVKTMLNTLKELYD